jgi:hypothetical protein
MPKRGRADEPVHTAVGATAAAAAAPEEDAGVRLQGLRVRRIVKENHGATIVHAAFHRAEPTMGHMLATVGGRQLNVYDNAHRGDHLDLVSHYVDDAPGDVVRCRRLCSPGRGRLTPDARWWDG